MSLNIILMICGFYTDNTGDQDVHKITIRGPKDFAGCIASALELVEKKGELWASSLVAEGMGAAKACLGGEIEKLQIDEVKEQIIIVCKICNIVFDFQNRCLTFNSEYGESTFDARLCGYDIVRSLFYFIVKFVIDTPAPGLELNDFKAQDDFINEYYG